MNSQNESFEQHMKDYWQYVLKQNPTYATYIGDHRHDDRLEDLSEAAIAASDRYFETLLQNVRTISEDQLSAQNRLNRIILIDTLQNHLQMFRFRSHYLPINQMHGPHIDFPQLIEFHPFSNESDVDNYLARMNAFPLLIDQVIENMKQGVSQKITSWKQAIEKAVSQAEIFTRFTPDQHPLYAPVSAKKPGFSGPDADLRAEQVRDAISRNVTPAYERLCAFLRQEYLPHCRDEEGIWALPDGPEMYRFYVKYHTTTDLTPEEIHTLGRSEVTRITSEIKAIMDRAGFSGSIRDFAEHMKQNKEQYPGSGAEILDLYRAILSEMDKRLPEFFGRLPEAAYDIKEIEKYREEAAPAAYYYPPPGDFSRPGYFYANTYRPELRPKFIMEALACHEAVPGHHLQIAIMQEQTGLPDFRRYQGSTAFIEGWALYAEKLAGEMGCYRDMYSEYGRLNFEIWRAVRLVVDTGIHHYRWTRDQAIQYCMDNSGEEEHEIGVEVDRYIAMPAQALAYKIGELRILALRERAKEALGNRFDIKSFHDRLLENGALPLNALESVMDSYLDTQPNSVNHINSKVKQ